MAIFSFLNRFEERNKRQGVWKTLRRLADSTVAVFPSEHETRRLQNRHMRCIPLLVVPWQNDQPKLAGAIYGLIKDVSDQGLAIIVEEHFTARSILCSFRLDEPVYLVGEVRHDRPLGGGFRQLGVELLEIVPSTDAAQLAPLAAKLKPEAEPEMETETETV